MRRLLIAIALLSGSGQHVTAQSSTELKTYPREQLDELREFIRATRADLPTDGSGTTPALRKGTPESLLRAAERFATSRNQPLSGEDAIDFVLQEASLGFTESFPDEPSDAGFTEAVIIPDALRRPSLLVCGANISDAVPDDWYSRIDNRRAAIATLLASVCLLSVGEGNAFGLDGIGTGFVVAPGVLMTNRHVAELFSVPDSTGQWNLRVAPLTGTAVDVIADFSADACGSTSMAVRVTGVLHVEPRPGPDVALLQLESDGPPPLQLQTTAIAASYLTGRSILDVGYPFNDSRNPLWARLNIFGSIYGVKRVAPGELQPGSGAPFGDGTIYLLHDASTLGGCSGSPIVDLENNVVLGLHFQGEFEKANFAWPMWSIIALPEVKEALGL